MRNGELTVIRKAMYRALPTLIFISLVLILCYALMAMFSVQLSTAITIAVIAILLNGWLMALKSGESERSDGSSDGE